ncbi:hypothetical protein D3C76_1261720 [compost metagenome]
MVQCLADEQEFQAEQCAHRDAGQQGAVAEGRTSLAPEHQGAQYQGCAAGADGQLQDRGHVVEGQLDRHLLEAPADAEDEHQATGEPVQGQAGGFHRSTHKAEGAAGPPMPGRIDRRRLAFKR